MSDEDKLGRWIAILTAMRQTGGGGAESQIHTQEAVTVQARVALPALQFLSVTAALVLLVAGLWLFSTGVDSLLDLGWDPGGYLIFWTVLLIALWGLAAAARRWLSAQLPVVQSFAVLAAALLVGIGASAVLLSARDRLGIEMAGVVVGGALVLGSAAWGYNQLLDLVSPYWRRSPYEQAVMRDILPALRKLLEAESGSLRQEPVVEDPRWRLRQGKGVVAHPVAEQPRTGWADAMTPEEIEEEERQREIPIAIDPEVGNLIWFCRLAARALSLSIADLTLRPAPTLPFYEGGRQRHLRRDMIRRLLARGSTEWEVQVDGTLERGLGGGGWWELQGQGATPVWVKDRQEAVAEADAMWHEVMGERPVPDYWADLDEYMKAA